MPISMTSLPQSKMMNIRARERARDATCLAEPRQQRIGERKKQRHRQTDDERSVDQTDEQEHAALQHRHQFRLTRGGLEELRAHDTDTDARAERAEADHEAYTDSGVGLDECDELMHIHGVFLIEQ